MRSSSIKLTFGEKRIEDTLKAHKSCREGELIPNNSISDGINFTENILLKNSKN